MWGVGGWRGVGAKGENEGVSQLEQVDDEEMENNILGTELWALAGFSRNVQIGHRLWQLRLSECAAAAGGFEINSFQPAFGVRTSHSPSPSDAGLQELLIFSQ